jgi:hypothetical protein
MAASLHVTHWQVSTRQYPHTYDHGKKAPRSNERPSIELKISGSGPEILNAVVTDSTDRPLYSISSDESRTTLLMQKDSTGVATIDWDRSSPRMVFRGKKAKCKEWLLRAGPETEYVLFLLPHASPLTGTRIRSRMFTHGDSQLKWMQQSNRGFVSLPLPTTSTFRRLMGSSQLIPANRPGLAVARWRTKSRADGLRLQIFQEVLVEPGLLEAILLSIILLQSGQPFGDTLQASGPRYHGIGVAGHGVGTTNSIT